MPSVRSSPVWASPTPITRAERADPVLLPAATACTFDRRHGRPRRRVRAAIARHRHPVRQGRSQHRIERLGNPGCHRPKSGIWVGGGTGKMNDVGHEAVCRLCQKVDGNRRPAPLKGVLGNEHPFWRPGDTPLTRFLRHSKVMVESLRTSRMIVASGIDLPHHGA